MARFKAGEEEHYGGQGGTGFFTISNDKEVKRVRFMYNNVNDVEGYAVHRVEIGDGKFRYVNCLRIRKVSDLPRIAFKQICIIKHTSVWKFPV